tara:strand:- start:775 stop:1152 length:378 start_codon:yes stop_codon:yes gene_type:complete
MKEKDPNYVIKIEKAIADKYGEETIQNPRSGWTDEKEKQYIGQLKDLYEQRYEKEEEHIEVNGVFVSNKLFTKETKRSCPVCNTYSFKSNDDVYMAKFECCEKCYIQWVEGRETRWNKGWRPNNE